MREARARARAGVRVRAVEGEVCAGGVSSSSSSSWGLVWGWGVSGGWFVYFYPEKEGGTRRDMVGGVRCGGG